MTDLGWIAQTEALDRLGLRHPASADLVTSRAVLTVQVRRQPRSKCAGCGLRRVLYRIAALLASGTGGTGETEARCSECWGLRD